MAKNPDFQKIVCEDVEFQWPRLDQPYRFDQHKKETVPCPPSAQNAGYSLNWIMPADRAGAMAARLSEHYEGCRGRNSKLPEFSGIFGMKTLEDGRVQFVARKSAMSNDGEVNKAPRVVDEYHEELEDKAIWSGSKGSVRALAFPSTNPQDGKGGISLLLDAVLVTDANYCGDNLEEDFGPPKSRGSMPPDSENPGEGMGDIPF